MPTDRPLLCATVTAADLPVLRARRDAAAAMADLVELRLDGLARPDATGALAGRRGRVVVTCRPVWEGGRFDGSEEERRRILAQALDAGAEYVDVEWRAGFGELVAAHAGRIVLSSHDFSAMPADLEERLDAMLATGAGVVKVAVMPGSLTEVHALAGTGRARLAGRRGVILGMGAAGAVTRLLPERFGSCWSYGSWGGEVAPGQIDVRRMIEEFRFREVGPATAVYGIAGRPLAHSLSPAMHNAAFAAAGIDAVYVPLEAGSADDLAAFVERFGVRGGSVTTPYKVEVMSRMTAVDPLAVRVGAANTFRADEGGWAGLNTDVGGFLAPLTGRLDLKGARCAVLGTGGAARAVAVALESRGARVTVYGRDLVRAAAVAALAGGEAALLPPPAGSWDLLVNATTVGMAPAGDRSPVEAALLEGGGLVYDLVYRPLGTRLLKDAATAGCETVDGLAMLVAQAERQFHWWTGRPAPAGVMDRAARAALAAAGEDRLLETAIAGLTPADGRRARPRVGPGRNP